MYDAKNSDFTRETARHSLAGNSIVASQEPKSMCRFCSFYHKLAMGENLKNPWDTVIAQTENFLVVPTKGAMVPGWLLILPKCHALSLSSCPTENRSELESLILDVTRLLTNRFGAVNLFEHGAVRPKTEFGCGIDHAHLHLACFPFDLAEKIQFEKFDFDWKIGTAPWRLGSSKNAYLAIQSHEGKWFNAFPKKIQSQFFRRKIASQLSKSETFDYDFYPNALNVEECISKLANHSNARD